MNVLTFDSACSLIRDADLLLWRRGGDFVSRAIAACGRGEYCHAAMAAWIDRELRVLEVRQFRGGRETPLGDRVHENTGRIDWYAVSDRWLEDRNLKTAERNDFDRKAATTTMRSFVGCRYGWWNLLMAGLRHLPVARLLVPVLSDLEMNRMPPFCSQAVAIAVRAGGVDPVPHLADRLTEPTDLARSLFYQYRGTLVA